MRGSQKDVMSINKSYQVVSFIFYLPQNHQYEQLKRPFGFSFINSAPILDCFKLLLLVVEDVEVTSFT